MPAIKYRVMLTPDEVEMLEALLSKGKSAARKQTRARILLKAAAGIKDAEIIEALAVSATMIYNTRQRCVEDGVEAALQDRPRPGKAPKLTDKQCAHLIATACTPAPVGHDHLDVAVAGRPGRSAGLCRFVQSRNGPSALKKTP